jgi:hypothetical protein
MLHLERSRGPHSVYNDVQYPRRLHMTGAQNSEYEGTDFYSTELAPSVCEEGENTFLSNLLRSEAPKAIGNLPNELVALPTTRCCAR